jgi:hypothetical protein
LWHAAGFPDKRRFARPTAPAGDHLTTSVRTAIRYFPDGFDTGDNNVWLTRLYRPETASSTIFYFVGLVLGYVPHAKSLGNGSHRAPVSHMESFVSEQAYVLLRHPDFSTGPCRPEPCDLLQNLLEQPAVLAFER